MTHALDEFKARANIDFITIGRHIDIPLRDTPGNRRTLPKFDGLVKLPKRNDRTSNTSWMTVQNPTKRDLQILIDTFHDAMLEALEVSVDFTFNYAVSRARNVDLYLWLRRTLAPQKHRDMKALFRRQYDPATRKYTRRKSLTPDGDCGTFIWEDRKAWMQTRLYIKEADGNPPVRLDKPVVRIEATLKSAGGTQNAGVHRVGLILDFIPEIRRFFMPMLLVGQGFQRGKQDIRIARILDVRRKAVVEIKFAQIAAKQERRWQLYGAADGLAKNLAITADRASNAIIGKALKGLSDRLRSLKQPGKVADYEHWKNEELELFQLFT